MLKLLQLVLMFDQLHRMLFGLVEHEVEEDVDRVLVALDLLLLEDLSDLHNLLQKETLLRLIFFLGLF